MASELIVLPLSANEPYSFGEAGVFPVETQTFKNPRKDTCSQMLAYTNKQHYDQRLVSILTLHNDHCVSQEKQGGEADVNA